MEQFLIISIIVQAQTCRKVVRMVVPEVGSGIIKARLKDSIQIRIGLRCVPLAWTVGVLLVMIGSRSNDTNGST